MADDEDDYYWFCGELADGSIVVADEKGNYFHAGESGKMECIAREHPKSQDEDFDVVMPRLKAEAGARAERMREDYRREQERKRRERLAGMQNAVPFQSGAKWGLKLGGKTIVPPIYRNIRPPVGVYCAVETSPRQWGVIMLDGRKVLEAKYTDVEINIDGTARLTVFPGKTKTVKLET